MSMKNKILSVVAGIVLGLVALVGFVTFTSQAPAVGVDLPAAPALFETILAAPMSDSATTMTIASNSVRGGTTLSAYNCFTIDEGSSQAEFVCGTVSGTTVSSLVRGISPADGITEVAALKFPHRRGSSVKVTDFPIIQILRSQNNGDATFENVLKYASGVVPSGANELADVEYVLSVVNGGAVAFDRIVVVGTAGATIASGDIIYFDATDQEWKLADVDAAATSLDAPIGIAQGSGSDGGAISSGVLILGLDTTQTGMTGGADQFLSSTAGDKTESDTALKLGRSKDADELYFNPTVIYTLSDNVWSGDNTFSGTVIGANNVEEVVFNTSGTWTKDAGLAVIRVQAWGAGGSGASQTGANAGGGGGGGYFEAWLTAAELGSTETVTVGVGGVSVSGDTIGNTGANTTFGALVTAYGGGPGETSVGDIQGGHGGDIQPGGTLFRGAGNTAAAGGVGSYWGGGGGGGVDDATTGHVGGRALYGGAGGGGSAVETAASYGAGGTSIFGGNGGAGHPTAGVAGTVPGGGGGGAGNGTSGAGAAGKIIVTEFY